MNGERRTGRPSRRRCTRWLGVALAVALVVGVLPAAAGAADYCVNTSCGGTSVGSFQQALDLAAVDQNADRIFLGAGNYLAPSASGFSYSRPDGPVEIIGAGQNASAVTSPSATTGRVLWVRGGSGTSVRDLTVHLPANVASGAAGLQTNGTATRVSVSENGTQSNPRYGVVLNGGVLEDSIVSMGSQATGASFQNGTPIVRRSAIRADTGIASAIGGVVERTDVKTTTRGLWAWRNTTTIRGSIIRVDAPSGTGIRTDVAAGADATVVADGVNIFGPGGPSADGLHADTVFDPGQDAEIILRNSLLRGFARALRAEAGGAGTARIVATYSDYDGSANKPSGANAIISESNISNVGDVGFQDPSNGDYGLLPNSQLIDAGEPSTAQGLDYMGKPLVADGNGDGVARRDIGALEREGVPFTSPPPTGGTGSTGGVPAGGQPAPDSQPPVVTGFRVAPALFAVARAATPTATRAPRGTRFRYALSEPARVTLRIRRRVGGGRHRTVGTLSRSSAAGTNRLRFSGRLRRRALRPGRYRALIRATDAAGNRSARRSVRFSIVRG